MFGHVVRFSQASFVTWLSLLERRERYFASAPELIVMPAAFSSALKALTLTPRFLALSNSSRRLC